MVTIVVLIAVHRTQYSISLKFHIYYKITEKPNGGHDAEKACSYNGPYKTVIPTNHMVR